MKEFMGKKKPAGMSRLTFGAVLLDRAVVVKRV